MQSVTIVSISLSMPGHHQAESQSHTDIVQARSSVSEWKGIFSGNFLSLKSLEFGVEHIDKFRSWSRSSKELGGSTMLAITVSIPEVNSLT